MIDAQTTRQLFSPPPLGCFCFLLIYSLFRIPVIPIISKSARPIFGKFSGFVELWLQMISLKSVFCHPSRDFIVTINYFLVLSTEMTFVTPVASGAAGRANVGLCSASSLLTFSELFLLLLSLVQLYFTIAID